MGLEALKLGFFNYLKELSEKTTKEYKVENSDVSVFSYSSEFKSYIEDELSVSSDFSSMSINDILEMDIVNGKLVDPNETTNIFEEQSENTTPVEQNSGLLNGGKSYGSMLSDVETTKEAEGTENSDNKSIITDLLNFLFEDKKVIDTLDTDSDGKLSEEEIHAFLETINEMDGDAENISLEDIIKSIEAIQNETLNVKAAEEGQSTEQLQAEQLQAEQQKGLDSGSNKQNISSNNSQASSSPSTGNSFSGNKTNSSTTNKDKTSTQDVTKMSMEDLQSELKSTDETIKEGQDTLSAVLDGTESEMKSMQESMDKAYEAYQKQLETVDKDMAEELDKRKEEAEAKEAKVDTKDREIMSQKSVVSDAERSYSDAVSSRESIESSISSLESSLSSTNDEEKSTIESNISSLKSQLEQAKIAEKNAKDSLDKAKETLEQLEEEKNTLEEQHRNLETSVKEYEQEIAAKYPEVAEAQKAYNEAKAARDEYKEGATSALQDDIEKLENYKSEITKEIQNRENKEEEKKYIKSGNNLYDAEKGEKLVETAKEMLSKYGESHNYCATGVSRTMSMAYGIQMGGNGCDWDTNMDKLVEEGMFTEVTDEYTSSSDLANLPAGAVVCWENTGGTSGGGAQYGHVTIANGKGGEISDHYQENIYKSIGGRSDQYRIFIPV